LYILVCIIE